MFDKMSSMLAQAQGIVPEKCEHQVERVINGVKQIVTVDECDFSDLVILANNIIQFLFKFGAIIAGLLIAYAGWLYLTSGGDTGNVSKAKGIFWKVIIGFVIMLAAYLIVTLILRVLGYQGSTFIEV